VKGSAKDSSSGVAEGWKRVLYASIWLEHKWWALPIMPYSGHIKITEKPTAHCDFSL